MLEVVMDDVIQCGNDLRFIEWWLHHHGGDPRLKEVVSELAAVTQGMVQVLASGQISNAALGREFRAESAKAFVGAANRLASTASAKATA
jgi:hypothetical protein